MEIKSKLLGPTPDTLRAWSPQPPLNMVPPSCSGVTLVCNPGQVGQPLWASASSSIK